MFSKAPEEGLPLVDVHNGLYRWAIGGLKLGALGVGDRDQGNLGVGLVGNTEQFGHRFFMR